MSEDLQNQRQICFVTQTAVLEATLVWGGGSPPPPFFVVVVVLCLFFCNGEGRRERFRMRMCKKTRKDMVQN